MPGSSESEASHDQFPKWNPSIITCFVSLLSFLFIQFILCLLPFFLPASSLVTLLPVAALLIVFVVGLGRYCKRIAGVRAYAPAFVFLSIFFTWAVYIFVIREVISCLEDIVFNSEIIMLLIGLRCMMVSDPGLVAHHSTSCELIAKDPETEVETHGEVHRRVRYCRTCRNYVMGFDHHCPAFGNCVGQRNRILFMVLLIGFVVSEVSYVAFAFQFTAKAQAGNNVGGKMPSKFESPLIEVSSCDEKSPLIEQTIILKNLVLATQLFSLFQVVWQVIFILWHVHCACYNIKTDEWINWKRYPEFHVKTTPHPGEPQGTTQFINPYNKGIVRNLKEFLLAKG